MLRRLILLASVFLISAYLILAFIEGNLDPHSIKGREYEIAALFTVIEDALEKNDGVLDLTEFTKDDDWDLFCLIMPYHGGSKYMIGGVDRIKEIKKNYPGNSEDSFGLGIFFLKDEAISEAIQIPSISFPEDYIVGKNLRKIMDSKGAKFSLPGLQRVYTNSPIDPQETCYSKNKTVKIDSNWKYTIADAKK